MGPKLIQPNLKQSCQKVVALQLPQRLGRALQLAGRSPQNGLIAIALAFALGFLILRIKARLLMGTVGLLSLIWLIRKQPLVKQPNQTQSPDLLSRQDSDQEADQFLANLLMLGSLGLMIGAFSTGADWLFSVAGLALLFGLGTYRWGSRFIGQQPTASLLILGGLTPKYTDLLKSVTQSLIPHSLESLMAWGGYWGLRLIGQPASFAGQLLSLPQGAVEVNWPCAGYEMVASIACASILMGVFFKQSWQKTGLLVVLGAITALVCNVPRIVILAMANAYWGKASFDFWHGSWGGQIVMGTMFTLYYYGAMAIIEAGNRSNANPQVEPVQTREPPVPL
jgi:exosortase/archaeosortase family protein